MTNYRNNTETVLQNSGAQTRSPPVRYYAFRFQEHRPTPRPILVQQYVIPPPFILPLLISPRARWTIRVSAVMDSSPMPPNTRKRSHTMNAQRQPTSVSMLVLLALQHVKVLAVQIIRAEHRAPSASTLPRSALWQPPQQELEPLALLIAPPQGTSTLVLADKLPVQARAQLQLLKHSPSVSAGRTASSWCSVASWEALCSCYDCGGSESRPYGLTNTNRISSSCYDLSSFDVACTAASLAFGASLKSFLSCFNSGIACVDDVIKA